MNNKFLLLYLLVVILGKMFKYKHQHTDIILKINSQGQTKITTLNNKHKTNKSSVLVRF